MSKVDYFLKARTHVDQVVAFRHVSEAECSLSVSIVAATAAPKKTRSVRN
jgi:hypothetical protein